MKIRKVILNSVIFLVLFIAAWLMYQKLNGSSNTASIGDSNIISDTLVSNDIAGNIGLDGSKDSTYSIAQDKEISSDQLKEIDESKRWNKDNHKEAYEALKSAQWGEQTEIMDNGNIPLLVQILSTLDISEYPDVVYFEYPPSKILEDGKAYYGEKFWYEYVKIDKIKEIKKNSKEAVLLNNGKKFAVIYGHLNDGEELRMFIMGMENVHDYYDPYVKKEDEVSNMTGWYVGTYDGIPAFCIPALLGGG